MGKDVGEALTDAAFTRTRLKRSMIENSTTGPQSFFRRKHFNDLTGVDVPAVADRLGREVDNAIWGEIAREEAAIRANPQSTRDPLLIGVFGLGNRI